MHCNFSGIICVCKGYSGKIKKFGDNFRTGVDLSTERKGIVALKFLSFKSDLSLFK